MVGLRLLWGAAAAAWMGAAVAYPYVPWEPGRKSFWPSKTPLPAWWMKNSTRVADDSNESHTTDSGWATAAQAVRRMGKGINLGNTFDMPAEYPERQPFERNMRMIDLFVEKGFTSVRIPVTWSGSFDSTSTFVSHVTQVVNYALGKRLWVLINTHHEGWLKCCYDDTELYNQRFANLWQNISHHFAGAGDHLLFEVLNEPDGVFGDWYHMSPPPTDSSGIRLTRRICEIGLRAIRQVTAKRVVFCAPNAQGNVHQAGAVFGSRGDFSGLYDAYVGVTLHTYDPWDFCGQTGNNSYWSGEDNMTGYYLSMIQRLQQYHRSTGIAVHIGEYGVGRMEPEERNADVVRDYYRELTQAVASHSWPTTLWDDGGWFAIVDDFNWVYGLADAALGLSAPAAETAPVLAQSTSSADDGAVAVKVAKHHSHVEAEGDADQSRQVRNLRAKREAEDSALMQGGIERHKGAEEGQGADEL